MALPDSSKDRGVTGVSWGRDERWKAHCLQRSEAQAMSDMQTQEEQLDAEVTTIQALVSRSFLSKLRSSMPRIPNFRDLLIGS